MKLKKTIESQAITLDEVRSFLLEEGYEDTPIFVNPDYADAFMGVSQDGRAVYDYEKMVESLTDENMTENEAVEFIEYNTMRTIPYMGEKSPSVVLRF